MAAARMTFFNQFRIFREKKSTFVYFQRCKRFALSYEARSQRLEEIARSPSGWVPPQYPPPSLPFQIKRSKTNNLPVYVDKKRGGSLVLTLIKNVKGDLNELVKFLRMNLGNDVHFQTNEITSQVKIKGYHKDTVVKLLKEHGF